MHIYITTVIFILGLVIASFLNALLYRIDNGFKYPDIYIKRSHCEGCGKELLWYELIPILSFLIFKGKCKKCGYMVPMYYPISELMLGISFASVYYFSFPIYYYILILFLFCMSYFDIVHKWVYQSIVHWYLGFVVVMFVINTLVANEIPPISLHLAIPFVLFIYILSKVMKKEFGMGDLLVLFGLGFILSIEQYISFLYVFLLISLLYSLSLIATKKATVKSSVPLFPIMYISFGILLLFNDPLLKLFNSLFII